MLIDIHTHNTHTEAQTIEAVGIHPWHALGAEVESLEAQAAHAEAIGEIGLDFACGVPREAQKAVFEAQLQLAERLDKAVVLHCVRAFEEVMRMLEKHTLRAVIFHGFIGSVEQAQRAVAQGYYLSFGERTARSPKSIAALRVVPLSQLFVESDESLTPIAEIYEQIATLRGIPASTLAKATRANFERLFGAHHL